MNPEDLSSALTSGLAGPMVGACLVLIVWLLTKLKSGVPLKEQLAHAWEAAKPIAIPALLVAGAALMAGLSVVQVATLAITAFLTAGGWAVPKPKLPPKEPGK